MADWIPGVTIRMPFKLPNLSGPWFPSQMSMPLLPPSSSGLYGSLAHFMGGASGAAGVASPGILVGSMLTNRPNVYNTYVKSAPPVPFVPQTPKVPSLPNPFGGLESWLSTVSAWIQKYWILILIAIAAIILLYAYLGRTSVKTTVVNQRAPE